MNLKLKAKILLGVMMLTPVINFTEATPKIFAVERVDNDIAQRRLNRDLYEAIRFRDVAGVRAALNAGADPNGVDPLLGADLPMLHEAVVRDGYGSHLEVIRELLQGGADVNRLDDAGRTPLFLAVDTFDWRLVRLLLEFGADVNAASGDWTALKWAAMRGYVDIARELVNAGANADDQTLRYARECIFPEMLELFEN